MTSPRSGARLASLALLVPLVAACAVGRPMAFTPRSNSFCADASASIAKLDAPTDPLRQLQFATDRYAAIEKAVSELTDSSLPGGAAGEQLRQSWLRPARRSLTEGRAALEQLRVAVNSGDARTAGTAFNAARSIGSAGVDTALLEQRGLSDCARLFQVSAT